MTLAQELSSTVEAVKGAVPAPIFEAIGQSIADLHASGLAANAANTGTTIGLPTLPLADGGQIDLKSLAQDKKLVLIFYRGGWCPYCNVALRAYTRRLDEFAAAGATIVAITPELADNARDTTAKNELGFPVALDRGNAYARSLGLVFALPENLRPLYRDIGIDLEAHNGEGSHELPLAATYVVASDGNIRWAFVEADFTTRAEPDDVLRALRADA